MLKFLTIALQFSASVNGYQLPATSDYPEIRIINRSQMTYYCLGADALACFDYIDNIMYLPSSHCKTLSLACRALIVHEATHVLQRANGEFVAGVALCIGSLEKQAYRTQDSYLRSYGRSNASMFGQTSYFVNSITGTC